MELITPGLGLIFWMTLAFLFLVFILGKFAWKPILQMLKERETSIHEALNEANSRIRDVLSIPSTGCEPVETIADNSMELAKLLE